MIRLKITQKKNGQQVAWFRSSLGRRVGTSMRAITGQMNWTTARQMNELAQYGIDLMLDRTAKGIGSDDSPMPPLKSAKAKVKWRLDKRTRKMVPAPDGWDVGYAAFKRRLGLKPVRDLRGPGGVVKSENAAGKKRYRRSGTETTRELAGGKGHMLDDIRVTYVDDTHANIDISNSASRTKARANEARAPWFGWSPSDMRKLMARAGEIFPMGIAERLVSLGLIAAGSFVQPRAFANIRRYLRRAA